MIKIGIMRRVPSSIFSDKLDVENNRNLAYQIFGVRNVYFEETHNFWLNLVDGLFFGDKLNMLNVLVEGEE